MKNPRNVAGFNPRLYPSCDGGPFELVPRADRHRRIKARFLAAYHRINVEYTRLRAVRQSKSRPGRTHSERRVLQALERAIVARETLEDRYASRGIVATPFYHDGIAINVRFQCPGAPAAQPYRIASSSCRSVRFATPTRLSGQRLTA